MSGANWLREQAAKCYRLAVARGKYDEMWKPIDGYIQIRNEVKEWGHEAENFMIFGDDAFENRAAEEYGDVLHAVLSIGYHMGYDVASELEKAQERNRRRVGGCLS